MNKLMTFTAGKGLIFLIALQLILGLVYLKTVPRVFNDDAWEMSLGKCLAEEGRFRHGIIEGWGGMHIHFLQNQVVQPFVLGGLYLLMGFSLWTSRFASLLMGVLALIAINRIMTRWFGPKNGFLISLMVLLHPWFFEISRRVRPEIFYCALAMCALWMFCISFERKNLIFPLLCGLFTALAGLSHPTGFVLAATFLVMTFVLQRPKLTKRQILIMATGLVTPILLYILYVLYALGDPRVNFSEQMRGGKPMVGTTLWMILQSERGRWLHFFQGSKGIGLGVLFFVSLIAAFIRSTVYDKTAAGIILLYSAALTVTTVNTTSRYLIPLLPFLAALLLRLSQRLFTPSSQTVSRFLTVRKLAAGGILAIYFVFCIAGVSLLIYKTRHADFDRVADRVAAVTGPQARVYGPMIFWLGNGKYSYGPFPLDYQWNQTLDMLKPYRYDYAIRTGVNFAESGGIKKPRESMPPFDPQKASDTLCRQYGTLVADFYDPDFGPVQIYKIDWGKNPGATKPVSRPVQP